MAELGLRRTHGRSRIIDLLEAADGPLGAAELEERSENGLPLSSIYRTLASLEETGVLVRHVGSDGVARYELAEWIQGHHHHLVCTSCGEMRDVELEPAIEAEIHRISERLGRESGYRIAGHGLEIEGVCGPCRS